MSSILTYIPTLNLNGAALCKFCLSSIKQYSRHDITLCGMDNISNYNCDDYDIVHIHAYIEPKFFEIKKAKIIYGIHNFSLNCAMGGYVCSVLNRFLKEPLTCLNCLGYIGIKTGESTLKTSIKMAKKADLISVHSDFMKEFYHTYNPVNLPLPLETDILIPEKEHDPEGYLFYSGRLSFEKNPYGFVDIINKTGLKAKMVLYNFVEQHSPGNTKYHYNEFLNLIKENKNIELIMNPSLSQMIELVKHAKFTVLPYLFSEPFGIAAANSVLCGTPVVAFPYGNVRNLTHLLPKTLTEMSQILKMDDRQYKIEVEKTLIKSSELRLIHKPENAIKTWDETYDEVVEQ